MEQQEYLFCISDQYKKALNENLKICKTEVACFTTCKAQPNDLRILILLINITNLSSTNRVNNDLIMIYVSESDIYTKLCQYCFPNIEAIKNAKMQTREQKC